MLDAVRKTIRRYGMLARGDKVVAGVSGGADSVALLHLLLTLREELELTVFAAHINHGLRGEESDADAYFVSELCSKWGVTLNVCHGNVKELAEKENLTLEEAGRQCRYAFFDEMLREKCGDKIAVAHNLNDNAETVVINLCRGTGLTGLCGIPAMRKGVIIRPLIEQSRSEIEAYLNKNQIPFRTDSTNLTDEFTRGRVRRNIFPLLTTQVNGNAIKNITRNASLLRDEDEFLEHEAEKNFFAAKSVSENPDELSLDISALENIHVALIRRVIRRAYEDYAGSVKDLTSLHVEQVHNIMKGYSGRETSLPEGVTVRNQYGRLIFSRTGIYRGPFRNGPQLSPDEKSPAAFSFSLEWDVPVRVPSYYIGVVVSLKPPVYNHEKACTKAFRCDRVNKILSLRTRRPGDRIALKGTGTRKLQDYFTDRKIPRALRDSIPLLADGSDILWIMDEANRVNERYLPPDENTGEGKRFYVTIFL